MRPAAANYRKAVEKKLSSQYPPIVVGYESTFHKFFMLEEERTHTHILGLPGQGKSKLLEFFCRHDIDRLQNEDVAPGFCLIDSSDFGNTFKKVLP
jgi:hypothetical protein